MLKIVTRYVPGVVDDNEQEVDWVLLAVSVTGVVGQVAVSPDPSLPVRVTVPAKLLTLVSETDIVAPLAPELRLARLSE